MLSQHPYNYIHCTYNATYVSAKPRSVISGLWCVVLLYIPERVDTLGLSVDCVHGYTCMYIFLLDHTCVIPRRYYEV